MNVVVLAVHGCPLAVLGPYGNEWTVTPNLDRLAAESIVFDQHISDCPEPAAARRAWRTGRLQRPPLGESVPTHATPDLLTLLTSAGVQKVLVLHTRPENDPPTEFRTGWDRVIEVRPGTMDELLDTVAKILSEYESKSPFLLWLEFDRLTPPWNVPQEVFDLYIQDLVEDDEPEPENETDDDVAEETDAEYAEFEEPEDEDDKEPEAEPPPPEPVKPWSDPPIGWFDRDDFPSWELLHRSFAAVVSRFDAELGQLFDLLRERGLDHSSAWVFTTDRGFPLGEHGMIGPHRPWLHEELIHIPLIVRLPEAQSAGLRISHFTQPTDLMPTLAGWFGASVTGVSLDGNDLATVIQDPDRVLREDVVSGLTIGGSTEYALRTPDAAFLLPIAVEPDDDPREPQLYEKPADRWELNDLRPRDHDRAEELERRLRERLTPPQ